MERKNVIILILAIIVFGYQNFKYRQTPRSEDIRNRMVAQESTPTPVPLQGFANIFSHGLDTIKNSVQGIAPSFSPIPIPIPIPAQTPSSTLFPSPSGSTVPHESPTPSITPTPLQTPPSIVQGTQNAGDATLSRPTKTSQEQAVLLQDIEGTIVYASRPDAILPLASLTKLMTAAIVIDTIPLNEYAIITTRAEHTEGDVATLRTGEIFSVRALLEAMLIASSNDAAIALEDHTRAQGIDLVSRMNEKARLWELHNTIFQNTTGLDAPGHHSTVRDLGKLTEKLLLLSEYTVIWEITRISEKEIISENNRIIHLLQNSNKLLAEIPGIYGGKTGTTKLAKECLALVITHGTKRYILIMLGSEDRFKDARVLIEKYL